jgi:hypothetical protein
MIHEVDESLRQFVRRTALPGTEVDVAFDAPTKDWASRRTGPVVDLYLYDIREDMTRRELGRIDRRSDDGLVAERHLPPRWMKLGYLVTAWTQRPEDEHRLLSVLLSGFLSRDSLPLDVLVGSLAEAQAQVPYTCGLPPPQDRALSDVWSALGGELKPSLDLVLTVPFALNRDLDVGPAVDAPLGIDMTDWVDGGVDQRRSAPLERPSGGETDAGAVDAVDDAEPASASASGTATRSRARTKPAAPASPAATKGTKDAKGAKGTKDTKAKPTRTMTRRRSS